jgi:hypothetical protein
MATLASLEQRLAALELEVSRLKAGLSRGLPRQAPATESVGARLIREAEESHAAVVAGWRKFMEELGIQEKPIGAKELREMLLQQGVNPETNDFSREIIAMREE